METEKETEIVEVRENRFFCDGGALGHPRIYLTFDHKKTIECPYCSKVFCKV